MMSSARLTTAQEKRLPGNKPTSTSNRSSLRRTAAAPGNSSATRTGTGRACKASSTVGRQEISSAEGATRISSQQPVLRRARIS